jgi:Na+-transporting NADH:ubiquinone oxidoreductase subunit C
MQRSVLYNFVFAGAVCVACAVVVSGSAVSLKDRQELNATLDKQKSVLIAAGLAEDGEALSREQVEARFEPIRQMVIDTQTGEVLEDVDPIGFDQDRVAVDPQTSRRAPTNPALVQRIPDRALIYEKIGQDGKPDLYVFPVQGKGLWSTLKGFFALDADLQTVRGLTFYDHKETPGLGGEVDNPRWKALWPGRKVYGPEGDVRLQVIKGRAGPPEEAPFRVDGLSGATITSRGVTNLIRFWLGENGFDPFLERVRAERRQS